MGSSLWILNTGAIIAFEIAFACIHIFSLQDLLTLFPLAESLYYRGPHLKNIISSEHLYHYNCSAQICCLDKYFIFYPC